MSEQSSSNRLSCDDNGLHPELDSSLAIASYIQRNAAKPTTRPGEMAAERSEKVKMEDEGGTKQSAFEFSKAHRKRKSRHKGIRDPEIRAESRKTKSSESGPWPRAESFGVESRSIVHKKPTCMAEHKQLTSKGSKKFNAHLGGSSKQSNDEAQKGRKTGKRKSRGKQVKGDIGVGGRSNYAESQHLQSFSTGYVRKVQSSLCEHMPERGEVATEGTRKDHSQRGSRQLESEQNKGRTGRKRKPNKSKSQETKSMTGADKDSLLNGKRTVPADEMIAKSKVSQKGERTMLSQHRIERGASKDVHRRSVPRAVTEAKQTEGKKNREGKKSRKGKKRASRKTSASRRQCESLGSMERASCERLPVSVKEGRRLRDPDAKATLRDSEVPLVEIVRSLFPVKDGKAAKPYFSNHVAAHRFLNPAKKLAEYVQGRLHVNSRNTSQAFVAIDGLDRDIKLRGMRFQNRAFHGDLVAIKVFSEKLCRKLSALDAKEVNGSDKQERSLERATVTEGGVKDDLKLCGTVSNDSVLGIDGGIPADVPSSLTEHSEMTHGKRRVDSIPEDECNSTIDPELIDADVERMLMKEEEELDEKEDEDAAEKEEEEGEEEEEEGEDISRFGKPDKEMLSAVHDGAVHEEPEGEGKKENEKVGEEEKRVDTDFGRVNGTQTQVEIDARRTIQDTSRNAQDCEWTMGLEELTLHDSDDIENSVRHTADASAPSFPSITKDVWQSHAAESLSWCHEPLIHDESHSRSYFNSPTRLKQLFERANKGEFRVYGEVESILGTEMSRVIVGKVKTSKPEQSVGPWHLYTLKPMAQRVPNMFLLLNEDQYQDVEREAAGDVTSLLIEGRIQVWERHHQRPFVLFQRAIGRCDSKTTLEQVALLTAGVQDHDVPFSDAAMSCLGRREDNTDDNRRRDKHRALSSTSSSTFSPSWEIPEAEVARRRDLRGADSCIFSVDPASARDLDDAVAAKLLPDGTVEVGVHIADVTFFLQHHSALDEEARRRATSVYLVDRVLPMLPRLLCEELCSLNPNVDRLAFSVIWRMTRDGEIVREGSKEDEEERVGRDSDFHISGSTFERGGVRVAGVWFGRSVIHSRCKLDYETAQRIIDGQVPLSRLRSAADKGENPWMNANGSENLAERLSNALWDGEVPGRRPESVAVQAEVAQSVLLLNEIAQRRRKNRFEGGALTFADSKLCFTLRDGQPVDIRHYACTESHEMIEEFMLLANFLVAEYLIASVGPIALLRRHPEPDEGGLKKFMEFMQGEGIEVDTGDAGKFASSLTELRQRRLVTKKDRKRVQKRGQRSSRDFAEPELTESRSSDLVPAQGDLKERTEDLSASATDDLTVGVEFLARRTMQKAVYFAAGCMAYPSWQHYALRMPFYTHFTSPIRRYADVVVHRLLSFAIEKATKKGQSGDILENCPTESCQNRDKREDKKSERCCASSETQEALLPYGMDAVSNIAKHCTEQQSAAKEAETGSVNTFFWKFLVDHGPLKSLAIIIGLGPTRLRLLDLTRDDDFLLEKANTNVSWKYDEEKRKLILDHTCGSDCAKTRASRSFLCSQDDVTRSKPFTNDQGGTALRSELKIFDRVILELVPNKASAPEVKAQICWH